MNFSPDEELLLMRFAQERPGRRWTFYAVVLTPIAAFGVFGMLNRDLAALVIAFLGAFGYVLWHMNWELDGTRQLRSIAQKVLAGRDAARATTAVPPDAKS
jgi:nitrate reductase NapE component